MEKVALFVTYTMLKPIVGGAFFRALRLAREMARRGWSPVICNWGPWLQDPKLLNADDVRFIRPRASGNISVEEARAQFADLKPAVTIMGEGAFQAMEPLYNAARSLDGPFIVLDQYYNHWLLPKRKAVDLVLMYALASFWDEDLTITPPYEITPPFIDDVTPKALLPVPPEFHSRHWITMIAYDDHVRDRGLDLLAQVKDPNVGFVVITRYPDACQEAAVARGIKSDKTVMLPLQADSEVFGFFAASKVTLLSNGFIQIMDSLAMTCPVITLERGTGVGMNEMNVDSRFRPWVSLNDDTPKQLLRIEGWLRADPFSDALRKKVSCERHGASFCANRIEALYRQSKRPKSASRSVLHRLARVFAS